MGIMSEDKDTQNLKATEISQDENHGFPKSLRYIKSRWLGKENKKFTPDLKEMEKFENVAPSDSVPSYDGDGNKKIVDDPLIIQLSNTSDMDLNINNLQSQQEVGRRRKALNTIKSYLEKNKSHETINGELARIHKNELSKNPSNAASFTDFNDSNRNLKNEGDLILHDNFSINTNDTRLDQQNSIFNIFGDNNDIANNGSPTNQTDLKNLKSALSSNFATLNKSKNSLLKTDKKILQPNLKTSTTPAPCNQTKMVSLFVGDLNKSVTETSLYLYFSKYNGLVSVKIPMDTIKNISLGYGYVNFDTEENAEIATDGLNCTVLQGSEIRIMPSIRDKLHRENLGANLFFSNLSSKLTSRIMYDRFKAFGKILSCKYSSAKCTCFISFWDQLSAFKVCKQFNQSEMDGKTVSVSVHITKKDRESYQNNNRLLKSDTSLVNINSYFDPKAPNIIQEYKACNFGASQKWMGKPNEKSVEKSDEKPINTQYSIFIKNLPLYLNENVIKTLVEPYGTVKNILKRKVPARNGAWALVTMTNKDAIDRCIQNLNFVEIDGKQLAVARAIPREEKQYAKRENNGSQDKIKLLISEVDLHKNRTVLENICSNYKSIKSAEFFSSSLGDEVPINKQCDGYGYIELKNGNDADILLKQLLEMGITCYKIRIEALKNHENVEVHRYPYFANQPLNNQTEYRLKSQPVSFSYLNPAKMFQIANFQNVVDQDKVKYYQSLENRNKIRMKERNNVSQSDSGVYEEKKIEIYHAMWEICVRMFALNPHLYNSNCGSRNGSNGRILSKSKIASLTDHVVKFFWNNNFEEFYHFMKNHQFDDEDNVTFAANSILAKQIVQSGMYLGMIPK